MPFLLLGGIIVLAIFLYTVYGNKARLRWQARNYAEIKPVKFGDYYSIISFWSVDQTSQDMVIHNVNSDAEESKMVILKSDAGYIMQIYGRDGNLITENDKTTTFDLATKFMEMRQPPTETQTPTVQSEPTKTRTIEFK